MIRFISKSQRILFVSFSMTDSGLCICHLFVWSNLNFLHNSLWISLPTQSYLVVYSLFVNLVHSLIMWFIVTSLSPYNIHMLFIIIIIICYSFTSVFTSSFSLKFEWQVSRTLLGFVVNAVIYMVSIVPLISSYSSLFYTLLETVSSAQL